MAPLYVEGSAFLTQPAGRAHRLGTHSLKKLTVPNGSSPTYKRSSVVSLICCSAKKERMSTTAGCRISVSIANREKCARSATWIRSR